MIRGKAGVLSLYSKLWKLVSPNCGGATPPLQNIGTKLSYDLITSNLTTQLGPTVSDKEILMWLSPTMIYLTLTAHVVNNRDKVRF